MSIVLLLATALYLRADTIPVFPDVRGRNLEGREFALPKGFEGELNVVLVAFRREQQADVDSWMPALRALAARHPALRVYELPTLSSNYRLMRRFIDGGMRRGIPDASVRAATITLYLDRQRFQRALGITGDDAIHVLLVDRQGTIHWRAQGPSSDAAIERLASQLKS